MRRRRERAIFRFVRRERVPRLRRSLSRVRGRRWTDEACTEWNSLLALKSEWRSTTRCAGHSALAFCHHSNYSRTSADARTPALRLPTIARRRRRPGEKLVIKRDELFYKLCESSRSVREQKATAAGDVRTPCHPPCHPARPFKPILTTSWFDNKVNDVCCWSSSGWKSSSHRRKHAPVADLNVAVIPTPPRAGALQQQFVIYM